MGKDALYDALHKSWKENQGEYLKLFQKVSFNIILPSWFVDATFSHLGTISITFFF